MLPRKVRHLLVPGRAMGRRAHRLAHAATRNMACCIVTGQAAGVAAALSSAAEVREFDGSALGPGPARAAPPGRAAGLSPRASAAPDLRLTDPPPKTDKPVFPARRAFYTVQRASQNLGDGNDRTEADDESVQQTAGSRTRDRAARSHLRIGARCRRRRRLGGVVEMVGATSDRQVDGAIAGPGELPDRVRVRGARSERPCVALQPRHGEGQRPGSDRAGTARDRVSCPSATQCTLVTPRDHAYTYNPQKARAPKPQTLEPATTPDGDDITVQGVACPTTSKCVAA